METPSVSTAKPQAVEDAVASTADISQSQPQPQPQPLSHELDASPVAGSSDVVVVSDDDFDHERNMGEDRDHDHGDNPIDTDGSVVPDDDELKQKIIRQVRRLCSFLFLVFLKTFGFSVLSLSTLVSFALRFKFLIDSSF